MALTKEQKQFVEMMKSKEVQEALGTGGDAADLEDLLTPIEVSDDDTMESLARRQQQQLTKIVKHFTKALEEAKNSAVELATADTRKREDAKIQKFAADNPGMSNSEVIELMQPLYDKGKTLEEAYKMACRALDLDPATGESPKEDKSKDKDKDKEDAKDKGGGKHKPNLSKRSVIEDDADLPDGGDEDSPKDTPKSLSEALAANSAAYIAKHGNPFKQET